MYYTVTENGDPVPIGLIPGISRDFAVAWQREAIVAETELSDRGLIDLFLFEMETETFTRLTRDGSNINPEWSPDDNYVYFDRKVGDDPWMIAQRRTDG